jgi:hypothetical protein
MSELARRGLTSYAERAILARRSSAPWRMGHGSPAPLEILCAYFTDVVIASIRVLRELVEHGRFVFVGDEVGERALLTLGQGLRPLEYVIVGTLRDRIEQPLARWSPRHAPTTDATWDGQTLSPAEWVARFRDEVAPSIVYGLYRATLLAPPQLFYARADLAGPAATIAIADSTFLEQRGFPLLLHMAWHGCRAGGGLGAMARQAYAAAGAPHRYGPEPTPPDDF